MEQYEALTDALDENNIAYKSMLKDEGHGYQIEARFELYQRVLRPLAEHLGVTSQTVA